MAINYNLNYSFSVFLKNEDKAKVQGKYLAM